MGLSQNYFDQFNKTFLDYIKALSETKLNNIKYCLFYPMLGKDYFDKREILIIGRAVNLWGEKEKHWDSLSANEDIVKNAIDFSLPYYGDTCAINWVNKDWDNDESHVRYSPFWQVIYKLIMQQYGCNDANWSYKMAWSNLYKIAPSAGGNPNRKLEWQSQLENCKKLFELEISELQPKNVIMITGLDGWAKDFVAEYTEVKETYVKAIAKIGNSNIIITSRPERKPQQVFIDEIAKYLVK
ncbi:MAG: hypothetical protein IPI31_13900 [Bacteroidetes bacterium]|nr:hypothetical protein [Bacteroidota bacterium]MBK7568910.1 hypothetical protein [Bacteroidota bacterium]